MEINKDKKIIEVFKNKHSIFSEIISSEYQLDFSNQLNSNDEYYHGSFYFPIIGFSYFWHPTRELNYTLPTSWEKSIITKINYSMPVFSFFDENGDSQLTLAFSEIVNEIETWVGVHEESASINFSFRIKKSSISDNEITFYVDREAKDFSNAIVSAREWIYKKNRLEIVDTPLSAKKSTYSTWYSFHQHVNQISLEKSVQSLKEYSLKNLIIDDGWQTDDYSRRYSFAGDWDVATSKFPDMKKISNIYQNKNINFMLWMSLPFIGINSKHWKALNKMFLYKDDFQKAGVLDPRFPEARKYMIEKAVNLVKSFNLSGLKLDFIDVFIEKESKAINENWDYENLELAIQRFLEDISYELREIEPDILIELREDYFGPFMNTVGNIIRVKDCPNNYIRNRIGIVKLKLLTPKAAIHSDMIMWNIDEEVSFAAKQVLNCLYGVPQISMRLDELKPEHSAMLKFWLNYIEKNQSILMDGEFKAFYPQNQYSKCLAMNDKKSIITLYNNNNIVNLDEIDKKMIDIVNASGCSKIILYYSGNKKFNYKIKDCQGNHISSGVFDSREKYFNIDIVISGILILEEVEK